jgi:hypothetical protein
MLRGSCKTKAFETSLEAADKVSALRCYLFELMIREEFVYLRQIR